LCCLVIEPQQERWLKEEGKNGSKSLELMDNNEREGSSI
ncbi:unnamed protein product, partial [Caretta caretta]